jgi:hypothetical protein
MLAPVAAHEGREVGGGAYSISLGWRNEPAYAGLLNGPEVFISIPHGDDHGDSPHDEAFPEDIAVSLQVEVTFGPETKMLTLEPAWGTTGHYIADLIPTMPGDYSFRIFGTIGDVRVDETFTSADGEFSTVEPSSDLMFPSAGAVDMAALLQRIADLEARIAELEAK